MDLGLHSIISATLARWAKLGGWVTFFAFLGGMAPDIWSHLPNIHTIFDHEPIIYSWYHLAHSLNGIIIVAAAMAVVIGIDVVIERVQLTAAALAFLLSFALHVGVDELWHKPGGGWIDNGFWYNLVGWALMLWINLPWAIRGLKQFFSKKSEGASNG